MTRQSLFRCAVSASVLAGAGDRRRRVGATTSGRRRRSGPAAQGGAAGRGRGQQAAPVGVVRAPLGDGPFVFDTAEQHKIRVVVVTRELAKPWSLAFLPDGSMLVTELRAGQLRIIRNGVLDPKPIAGVPKSQPLGLGGLMDVVLHPRFAENKLIYLTYSKPDGAGKIATTLARGRWDGAALTDVRDLFVAQPYWNGSGGGASRLAFGRDGTLFMTTGASVANLMDAQEPGHHKGKVLRLQDDGTVPGDNPFVGRAGYKPEIYSLGHRNQIGLAINPETGAVWSNENGPNGGDEINIILPGRNYGWPIVSLGRDYAGPWQGKFAQDGHRAAGRVLDAVDRRVGHGVLHRRSISGVEGQRLRRRDADGGNPEHRPPPAPRVQRERRRASPRVDADRAPAEDSGRASGARRAALPADGRDPGRAAQNRTGRVGRRS